MASIESFHACTARLLMSLLPNAPSLDVIRHADSECCYYRSLTSETPVSTELLQIQSTALTTDLPPLHNG